MAIWRQGGFFQDLAEREQHLQWYPKAFVPVTKVGDENVISITCCTCGDCVCCAMKAKKEEPKKEAPKEEPKKECTCGKGCNHHHHHHHCHCCCC